MTQNYKPAYPPEFRQQMVKLLDQADVPKGNAEQIPKFEILKAEEKAELQYRRDDAVIVAEVVLVEW